jgi:hypothetical protein
MSVSKNKSTRAAFLTTLQERQASGAASQPWIPKGEQSGLLTRIAAEIRSMTYWPHHFRSCGGHLSKMAHIPLL